LAELANVTPVLNRFLAGFGVRSSPKAESIIEGWTHRAVLASRGRPEIDLAAIALSEAEADVNQWFEAVLGPELIGDQPPARIGRAAYLLCGAGDRWPECFLSREPLPQDLTRALRDAVPPATPP